MLKIFVTQQIPLSIPKMGTKFVPKPLSDCKEENEGVWVFFITKPKYFITQRISEFAHLKLTPCTAFVCPIIKVKQLFSQVTGDRRRGCGLELWQERFTLSTKKNLTSENVRHCKGLPRKGWNHYLWKCSKGWEIAFSDMLKWWTQ